MFTIDLFLLIDETQPVVWQQYDDDADYDDVITFSSEDTTEVTFSSTRGPSYWYELSFSSEKSPEEWQEE